ncbi:MAG: polysaccharide biosynthesis/export family protein [Candidatus Omnitrophota bacterium]|nr:polysaccharide biosynthesis/export family protein [Candidatus Omnitrophota bacterium]
MIKIDKLSYILLGGFLFFFTTTEPACFALSPREESISKSLERAKEVINKSPSTTKISPQKSFNYIIGKEDTLSISVWQNLGAKKKEGELEQEEYAINKGDVLEIAVWQWPDLQKDVIVRPDGKISYPLVGDIRVDGMSLTALDDLLTKKLSEFIKSPEVSIMVKQFGFGKAEVGVLPFIKIVDLSFDNVKVRSDGKISLPPVGDIQAEGLSPDELRLSLSHGISKLLNNPDLILDVFVQITDFGGNKVIILGEVGDPGVYEASNIRIVEALGVAGGYSKDAILRNVFVLRGDLNNPQVIKVNLSKAITGRDFSQNIPIEPRDIIYVPKSLISDANYIMTKLLEPLTSSASAVSALKTIRTRPSPKR